MRNPASLRLYKVYECYEIRSSQLTSLDDKASIPLVLRNEGFLRIGCPPALLLVPVLSPSLHDRRLH